MNGWHKNDQKNQIKHHIEQLRFGRPCYGVGVGPNLVTKMTYDPALQTFVWGNNHQKSQKSSFKGSPQASNADIRGDVSLTSLMHQM